jgi:hypothetical protein
MNPDQMHTGTANQLVIPVVKIAKSVVQLSRSKHWIIPDERTAWIAATFAFSVRWLPFLHSLVRFFLAAWLEVNMFGFRNNVVGRWCRRQWEASARKYLKKHAPPEYLDTLTPTFAYGCKVRQNTLRLPAPCTRF